MKVLHIDTERTWRGGEQQMCYLARGMIRLGHEAHVLCRPGSECEKRAVDMGIETHPLPIHGDLDLWAARRIAKLVDRFEFDIVHAHTARAHLAAALAKRFSARRPKCVVHRRVDFSIHKLPLRLSGLKYRWGVDKYIAVTAAVRDVMISDGIPGETICVIHSGTDLSRFDNINPKPGLRKELGIPEGRRVIGNVGFLVGHKGHKYLIDAASAVFKEFPDAFFAIIGEGPLRGEIEAQARALGIEANVRLSGFRSDVPHCLKEFEIFCLPSWGEGIGGVVLEAMASRLPVVTTSAGGLAEVVRNGENGLLVPVRDSTALANGILQLLRNPSRAQQLSEAGRRTVEREFTADRMIEKTVTLYKELLTT